MQNKDLCVFEGDCREPQSAISVPAALHCIELSIVNYVCTLRSLHEYTRTSIAWIHHLRCCWNQIMIILKKKQNTHPHTQKSATFRAKVNIAIRLVKEIECDVGAFRQRYSVHRVHVCTCIIAFTSYSCTVHACIIDILVKKYIIYIAVANHTSIRHRLTFFAIAMQNSTICAAWLTSRSQFWTN